MTHMADATRRVTANISVAVLVVSLLWVTVQANQSHENQVLEASATVSSAVPDFFTVSQNYPNPFNASTNLKYDLPEAADVQIRVYNILGREVRRLVDRNQQPGSYTAHWNGADDQGEVSPSGLYFLVLLADDNWAVRKMMLVK